MFEGEMLIYTIFLAVAMLIFCCTWLVVNCLPDGVEYRGSQFSVGSSSA